MTNLVQSPTESRRISRPKSNLRALREWGDFLAPEARDAQEAIRTMFAAAKHELHRRAPTHARAWDEDKLLDFLLNSPYPDDIEEQIERSWRR